MTKYVIEIANLFEDAKEVALEIDIDKMYFFPTVEVLLLTAIYRDIDNEDEVAAVIIEQVADTLESIFIYEKGLDGDELVDYCFKYAENTYWNVVNDHSDVLIDKAFNNLVMGLRERLFDVLGSGIYLCDEVVVDLDKRNLIIRIED